MKTIAQLICFILFATHVSAQSLNGTAADFKSLDKQLNALHDAFAKGDAHLVAQLHHPDIVKYFGKNNVVTGRAELEKGLEGWFKSAKVEFIENTVESTVFTANTAIQTSIFAIRSTPKNGGEPTITRGRSMVIYIRDSSSPTGWLSLREMAQEAPDEK